MPIIELLKSDLAADGRRQTQTGAYPPGDLAGQKNGMPYGLFIVAHRLWQKFVSKLDQLLWEWLPATIQWPSR
jgi:hypothetical protein